MNSSSPKFGKVLNKTKSICKNIPLKPSILEELEEKEVEQPIIAPSIIPEEIPSNGFVKSLIENIEQKKKPESNDTTIPMNLSIKENKLLYTTKYKFI